MSGFNALFLDTETTGTFKKKQWDIDYNDFPRIVSIAWDCRFGQKHHLVNQKGEEIPPEATKIHGITNEMAAAAPHGIASILGYLVPFAQHSDYIVGYNVYFDTSVIKANYIKYVSQDEKDIQEVKAAFDKSKRIDVMWLAAKYFRMRIKTLSDLHYLLFKRYFDAHNAMGDVIATKDCFYKLLELGAMKTSLL